jgi:hypothetical protein
MNSNDINEKIKIVVEHCRDLTLRLVRLSQDHKQIQGIASGFLIKVGETTYLVSAGHALEKSGWMIETTFTIEDKCLTACIPIGGPWILKKMTIGQSKLEEVDIAWANVDFQSFQKAVSGDSRLKGKEFTYTLYQGPLDDFPSANDPHIFASWNRGTRIPALGRTFLERDLSYEYEMEFKGVRSEDGLYIFSIPKHKGHDYYSGASGSPIIEPSGRILAVLVKGCESKNELYGYPMRGLVQLIKIGAEVETGTPENERSKGGQSRVALI